MGNETLPAIQNTESTTLSKWRKTGSIRKPTSSSFRRTSPRVRFSALAKPAGASCNLDCTYCFFLSKEMLTRSQQMSDDQLRIYLTNFLDSQPDGDVTIEWQGGEPTLRGVEFFEKAVRMSEELKRPGQRVHHAIQTNGTLLDDHWGEFLAAHHFLVGISIDGPQPYHDAYRVNRAGRGTHAQVIRGWQVLQRHGVDTNILCTVHAGNEQHPLEVYRYFRDELHAEYIQFIPIVERVTRSELTLAEAGWHDATTKRPLYRQSGSDVTSRSVSPKAWGSFLSTIFDEWVRHDVGRMFVQLFDVALGNALGEYTLCTHAPVCGGAVAVLHNGDIYACDHWVEPGYERGNVATRSLADVVSSPEQERFGKEKYTGLSNRCMKCPVRWACHGGCPKDRFVPVDGGIHRQNYLCAGYRRFFTHIQPDIEIMARLLQSGRDATQIMRLKSSFMRRA
ncbi:anaerobic sulfatase maturase [Bifidobacterium simiarum]|uniref:anaerobic sulfatase maturase n=1 Tax=Bifidobacterium simiarum TaxID=2045441 RepID=UPI001BDCC38A|nr:anaerobic sulfatase maturase [Bifidobacterium simiarum]MBT1166017.1 anaerobic sulfatase maturase [Bifidobacterium simiarum]